MVTNGELVTRLRQYTSVGAKEAADEIERLQADKAELLAACKWLELYARVQVERHPHYADSPNWQKLLDAVEKAEGKS